MKWLAEECLMMNGGMNRFGGVLFIFFAWKQVDGGVDR